MLGFFRLSYLWFFVWFILGFRSVFCVMFVRFSAVFCVSIRVLGGHLRLFYFSVSVCFFLDFGLRYFWLLSLFQFGVFFAFSLCFRLWLVPSSRRTLIVAINHISSFALHGRLFRVLRVLCETVRSLHSFCLRFSLRTPILRISASNLLLSLTTRTYASLASRTAVY